MGDRFPLPVAVDGIPLVIRFDPVQLPAVIARDRLQIGAERHDRKRRRAAFGHGQIGEIGLDPQRLGGGQDQRGIGALDRAAGTFQHVEPDRQVPGPGRLRHGRRQSGLQMIDALRIGGAGKHACALRLGLVMAAEDIAFPARQAARRAQCQFALDRQVGGRGAVKPARGDIGGHLLRQGQRRVGQVEIEIYPLGQEVLDQHPQAGKCRPVFLDAQLDLPGAARRGGGDREIQHIAASRGRDRHQPGIFGTIGAQDGGGKRQSLDRLGQPVAGQDGGMRGLAGAIGATVERGEDIDGRGRRIALDPAIRQVEFGIHQRQDAEIRDRLAIQTRGGDQRRFRRRAATGQPGVEMRKSVRIGHGFAENRVPARDQCDLDPRPRGGVRKAAHRDGQPVGARKAGQAQIRDHEPLRRRRRLVLVHIGQGRRQRIDARLQRADLMAQVEPRRHLGIDRMAAAARRRCDSG